MTEVSITKNQSTNSQSKSMDWFLYVRDLHHESLKSFMTRRVTRNLKLLAGNGTKWNCNIFSPYSSFCETLITLFFIKTSRSTGIILKSTSLLVSQLQCSRLYSKFVTHFSLPSRHLCPLFFIKFLFSTKW